MNNKAIIEFSFRRIWRILQISEGVIHRGRMDNTLLDLQNSSYPTQLHSIIGPLQDPVTWYKIAYTGDQVEQWDFQNNVPAFVL